jgi:predicted N-acyltransferase
VPFTVEVHDRLAELDRGEWNAVVAAAGAAVFYDYDVLAAYEAAPLEPDGGRAYLAVRDGSGRLAGVLPTYVQDPMNTFFHLPEGDPTAGLGGTRGLLTHFWHCYDSSLPLLPGIEEPERREVFTAVCAALGRVARERGACGYGFLDLAASRPEAAWLADLGFPVRPLADRFVLDLGDRRTMDDYMPLARPGQRQELRRQRRLADAEGLTLAVREGPDADLDAVVTLCRQTAARYGGEAYYPAETFGPFLRQAGPTLRVITVHAGDTLVGTGVCFRHLDRFHAWAAGMRYDLCRASPYTLVFHETVRYALESGASRVEGGRGNGRFKMRMGFVPVPLVTALRRV